MSIQTGPGGLKPYGGGGLYSEFSTDAGFSPYLPYGGSYYQLLFYNPSGYGRLVGRVDYTLSISQNHGGSFNFYVSRYGGAIQTISNSGYATFSYHGNIGGNVNHHGIRWTNPNTNTWGNGTMGFRVMTWSHQASHIVSGTQNNSSQSNYTSHSSSNSFLKRII
jgi:hypothetical protein